MTALTGPRATPSEEGVRRRFPVKGGVKIFQGAQIVLAAGLARPGVAGAGLVACGRATGGVDALASADGALFVEVERGTFKWANNGADPLLFSDVGALAYVLDDATVTKTATGRSSAGTVFQVDADGVWVTV
jgi:hypothetical protein